MGKTGKTIEKLLEPDVTQDTIDELIFQLIKARKDSGITLERASEITGIPENSLLDIESFNPRANLDLETLIKTADAMGLSLCLRKKGKPICKS